MASLVAGQAAFSQTGTAPANSLVIQVKDQIELQEKFCAANPTAEHIFVLPAALFVDSELLICRSGYYELYRVVDNNDTDDFEYSLDPPFHSREIRLGCDGKAGRNMVTVAINCRPMK